MNTADIFKAFKVNTTLEYLLENTYIFAWESDIFGISKSGYINEIEVKSSRADFQADFKKIKKHQILKCAHAKKKVALFRNNLHYRANRKNIAWIQDVNDPENPRKTVRGWDGTYTQMREVTTRDLKPNKDDCNVQLLHSSIRFVKIFCPHRFYYACPEGLIKKDEIPEYAGLYWVTEKGTLIMKKQAPILHKFGYNLTKILLDKFYYNSINLQYDNAMLKRQLDHNAEIYYKGDLVDQTQAHELQVEMKFIDKKD